MGIPIIRTIIYWGLYWGTLILRKCYLVFLLFLQPAFPDKAESFFIRRLGTGRNSEPLNPKPNFKPLALNFEPAVVKTKARNRQTVKSSVKSGSGTWIRNLDKGFSESRVFFAGILFVCCFCRLTCVDGFQALSTGMCCRHSARLEIMRSF